MDWSGNLTPRHPSIGNVNFNPGYVSPFSASPQRPGAPSYFQSYQPLLPPSFLTEKRDRKEPEGPKGETGDKNDITNKSLSMEDRYSYYLSSYPLNCSAWTTIDEFDTECIALSSYKEGFSNKLHIVHGVKYGKEATIDDDMIDPTINDNGDSIEGFDLYKVAETGVDYPITNLQWDPAMSKSYSSVNERLATSSEVLRLYKVDHENYENNNDYKIHQTHYLANNTTASAPNKSASTSSSSLGKKSAPSMTSDICPPVTSFDWNKVDTNVIITSSVDTTCTVWDLNRSMLLSEGPNSPDTATIKTQLIAHDSEVFDVKFLNDSTNVFASVGNDGSMRIFDLRSLEHSTIIYEPPSNTSNHNEGGTYNSKALVKLAASNVDQNYLASVGVNSNQVIILDTRMPGMPVTVLDGSFGGLTNTAISSLQWHPNSNFLLTGGDDCQALIWDCNSVHQLMNNNPSGANNNNNSNNNSNSLELSLVIDSPVLSYQDNLEVNNVCWRGTQGDWIGVVSGKGFQAVLI